MGNDPGNGTDPSGGLFGIGGGVGCAATAGMSGYGGMAGRIAGGLNMGGVLSTAVAMGGIAVKGASLSSSVSSIGNSIGASGSQGLSQTAYSGSSGPNAGSWEDDDDSDIGWTSLYKDDLKRYYKEVHGREGTENELGNEFEFEFENWVNQDIIRRLETRIRRYPGPTVNTGGDRNTKPDFVGDALIHSGKTKRRLQMADWWELKQKNGGLYLSSDEGQLRGHIDNLRRSTGNFYARYGRLGFRAKMYVATTADVKFSPSASRHAKDNKVLYEHVHAEYRIVNGSWQFRFTKTISR
jgi:hypothetical protein